MNRYPNDFTVITAELVSTYVGNNPISSKDIPALISTIHAALVALSPVITEPAPEFVSAVTPRKSLASPDYIISMIDGKPYRSLKRHLAAHGLTPEEYRTGYSLVKLTGHGHPWIVKLGMLAITYPVTLGLSFLAARALLQSRAGKWIFGTK